MIENSGFLNHNKYSVLIALLILFSLFRLIWVGDIPYGNDDAQLFLRAMSDSESNHFTSYGLLGSRGMNYGPFAIWTYRLGLFFTRDLITFAWIRILITTSMVSLAVFMLARLTPKLIPSLGFLALLSPYLWLYGRDLWDNSYVIPLSGLAITSYLNFCKKESRVSLLVSFLLCTFGILTHLVYLPIAAGLGLHLIFFKKQWVKNHLVTLLSFLTICFIIFLPYLLHLLSEKRSFTSGEVSRNLGHLFMPLLGPRFFTALGIEHFVGKDWYHFFPANNFLNGVWILIVGLSALVYPISWLGIYRSFKVVWSEYKSSNSTRSDIFDICFICCSIFTIELGLSFYLRLIPIPNFYSPFWLIFFFYTWFGFTLFWGKRAVRAVFYAVTCSLLVGTIGLMWQIHKNSGNRWNHYGPTLGNLLQISKEVEAISPNAVVTSTTFHLSRFPMMLDSLRKIVRPTIKSDSNSTTLNVRVEYAEPNNLQSGKLILQKN